MKKLFNKVLFCGACIALALFAGAFAANIAQTDCGISQMGSYVICGGIFTAVSVSSFYAEHWLPSGALYMALAAKNIARNANPKNIGGMEGDHYYAFVEDIATWPVKLSPDYIAATNFGDLVSVPEADPFVMLDDKYFYKIPCTLEEGAVKSTLVGPTDSKAFENSATFSNAGNNDELRGWLAYTANKPVVILMKELNGTVKVVGTQGYPARLDTAEGTNGGKVSDGNILKHSYKCSACVPCATYLAPIPVEGEDEDA